VEEFTESGVKFTDGKEAQFDAVVLATGYRPRVNAFLHETKVYDENGTPVSSGHEASNAGLYFCGYYVSPTGMLREIAMEAKQISAEIARKSVRKEI
jgi:NAD(P)H-nitrite reductase large subunit